MSLLIEQNDIKTASIEFEMQGFDLETGQVKQAEFPWEIEAAGADFKFAYNGNHPTEDVNAVLFQNQSPENPVEIAFLDEVGLHSLTQVDVDNATFTTGLIGQAFEYSDTVLIRTPEGNVFAIGNSQENDLPGQDNTVTFDYALVSSPPPAPIVAQEDIKTASIEFEMQGFDLETGQVKQAEFPWEIEAAGADFKFAYNGNHPTEDVNAVLFQNQSPENPVEIAFLDEVGLHSLTQVDVDNATFTTGLMDQAFEHSDTVLIRTPEGNVFAIGNSQENDLPGQDNTVTFDYSDITDFL